MLKFFKILAALFLISNIDTYALPSDYYASSSLLSSGKWVELSVDTAGIYEISYAELLQLGFEKPENVSVFGRGASAMSYQNFSVSRPDDLTPAPYKHINGKLFFFGDGDLSASPEDNSFEAGFNNDEGVDSRCHYDKKSHYFITDSRPLVEIASFPYSECLNADPLDYAYVVSVIENDVKNPARGGVVFHDVQLRTGESSTYKFRIKNFHNAVVNGSKINGTIRATFAANSTRSLSVPLEYSDNLPVIGTYNVKCAANRSSSILYTTSNSRITFRANDNNPLEDEIVSVSLTAPSGPSYFAVDRVSMSYPQSLDFDAENQVIAYFPFTEAVGQNFTVKNVSPNIEAWNVGNPDKILRYEFLHDKNAATATATFDRVYTTNNGAARIAIFDPDKPQLRPFVEKEIANQNIHGMATPQMLIVTTETLYDSACRLARIHRELRGLDVAVVTQNQLFNEFSSGARIPHAIRRAVKMFYDRNPDRLRDVLLYGASTFDNRHNNVNDSDQLVCFEAEDLIAARSTTSCYCADLYFGMLSDNYVHASIWKMPTQVNIGRIPAYTTLLAQKANEKIETYIKNPTGAAEMSRVLMTSGAGDDRSHYEHALEALGNILQGHEYMTVARADCGVMSTEEDAQKNVAANLKKGVGYFGFSGHGGHAGLLGPWNSVLVKDTDYSTFPFAMLSTCEVFDFDCEAGSMVEEMFFKPDGGVISAIAACRAVYLELNKSLNNSVANAFANAVPGSTWGDLFRIARNYLIQETNISQNLGVNILSYNFCGDPSVEIPLPKYNIRITDFNTPGMETLTSNAQVRVVADILDPDGNIVSDFNGPVLIEYYDSPTLYPNRDPRKENDQNTYVDATYDFAVLAQHQAVADGGKIDATFFLPEKNSSILPGRLVITATDSVSDIRAVGVLKDVEINDVAGESQVEHYAPVIKDFYLDDPSFTNGDHTGTSVTAYAVIDPSPAGLQMKSVVGLDNPVSVKIDGNTSLTDRVSVLPSSDGKYLLTLKLADLSQGRHTLEINVANSLGEKTMATIDFVASEGLGNLSLALEGDKTVRNEAAFFLEHDFVDQPDVKFVVENIDGDIVYTDNNCTFPMAWELTDNNGFPVADGKYKAYVVARAGSQYGSSGKVEFIVIK